MALSQVSEYMEDTSKISPYLSVVFPYFSNPNPMLRYAACHAVGQFADDLSPKYQELYGSQTFSTLVQILKDPVPRVVAHSAAALTNFL
jgi:hypothetical protein